ncbi:MAG: DUF4374 domain-containing protein [Bacteroidota bacterium]
MNRKRYLRYKYIMLTLLVLLISCSDDDSGVQPVIDDGEFSYLIAPALESAELYPMHPLTTLQSGTTSISQAQEIPDVPWNVLVAGRNGFVYLNYDGTLSKYSVDEQGILVNEGSVLGTGVSGGPLSTFTTESEMFVSTGTRFNESGVFAYQIINTDEMSETANGTITIDLKEGEGAAPSIYIFKEGKILVPYIHYDADGASYPFAPMQVYDAATMTLEKTISDDRTAGLGLSVVNSHGFDEAGNLYLISCPSNYWVANEDKPSGLLRINNGATDFDADYFMDLSSKFEGNHTAGFLYVGNNKAIVQVFDSEQISEYADYQWNFSVEYHVVDVITGETERLDIPLSLYPRHALDLARDGKGMIATTTETENAIYIYDSQTSTLSKGLVYDNTDYFEGIMTFR